MPLNIVIERLKQGLKEVPERNEKGHSLLFHLSPNDLVYVPTKEEIESKAPINIDNIRPERVYKREYIKWYHVPAMNVFLSRIILQIRLCKQQS
ncbi:MAG: hypothetical protein LBL94_02670 [Prevotellaceae bacterium]|jgi:hypothetical protein|nr:hypothetical protein [Prevotellaceae bacterium]